jgi:ABC-2 type transport system permease protein
VIAVGARPRELAKFGAFMRRDLLISLSYRLAFFGDIFVLLTEIVVFAFVSKLVDTAQLPRFGGEQPTYLAFVVTGMLVATFLQLGTSRVVSALREEQMIGTLESLFVTPTSPWMLQLGLVVFDLVYVPARMTTFLVLVSTLLDAPLHLAQLGPSVAVMLVFMPLVWGLGIAGAAVALTFKRGGTAIGLVTNTLALGSGAYFPLELLPGWARTLAEANPVAQAVTGVRDALLGGAGWAEAVHRIGVLLPWTAVSLTVGVLAFSAALRRERRLGTLGQY